MLSGQRRPRPEHALIAAIVGLSAACNAWGLANLGWGNAYYSAAVRSMGSSWHSFFFASFDAGGFVSVDKPPLSLWVQVVSTKLFGYSRWSVLMPEVLAGAAAVWLLYWGLRRSWGRTAGIVGAAALALMPINVAVNHTNNTDAVLVLLMTAAAVAGIEAVRNGSIRWLVAACALAGCAMTSKMLAAAPVMPAILIAYAWCAPSTLRVAVRLRRLAVGAAVMAAVGLWWFVAVQLTPVNDRPYVGSTKTNSVFELAFERNGVHQVEGDPGSGVSRSIPTLGFSGGPAAPLRLLDRALGTQLGWLIPLGVVGAVAALVSTRARRSPRLGALVIMASWFAAGAIVYSWTAGVFHPYYLAGIGPPLAALVGIGIATFRFDLESRSRIGGVLALLALGLTAWAQWVIWRRFVWRTWFIVIATVAMVAVIVAGAVVWRRLGRTRVGPGRASVGLAVVTTIAVLLAPAMWVQGSEAAGFSGALPYAHPTPQGIVTTPANHIAPNGGLQFPAINVEALVQYLRSQRAGERWIVAVPSAAAAEEIVITAGESVMAVGGFLGSDQIASANDLQQMVRQGQLRFFLLATNGIGSFSLFTGGDRTGWVVKACPQVVASAWQGDAPVDTEKPGSTAFVGGPRAAGYALYDCRGKA